jgi:hypothetical protein
MKSAGDGTGLIPIEGDLSYVDKKSVTSDPDSKLTVGFSLASPLLKLGFLAAVEEPSGYIGGYLITNAWGRPLEFRVSNPVQPSRIQQILYGCTLRPYILADLIGKTLVEKTATTVEIIFTDCRAVLDLRRRMEKPMAWLATGGNPREISPSPESVDCEALVTPLPAGSIYCHPEFAGDKPTICKLIKQLPNCLDLSEPFDRIREAMGEARKMSITNRAS